MKFSDALQDGCRKWTHFFVASMATAPGLAAVMVCEKIRALPTSPPMAKYLCRNSWPEMDQGADIPKPAHRARSNHSLKQSRRCDQSRDRPAPARRANCQVQLGTPFPVRNRGFCSDRKAVRMHQAAWSARLVVARPCH